MEKRKYEDNRFHKARHEIAKINEPIDIAAAEYANKMGWDWTDGGEACAEYDEFMTHCAELQKKTTATQNFVAMYFFGE